MTETNQRKTVIRALKPLHAIPVENPIKPGTPDINFVGGWMELKWLRKWPPEGNIVRLPHFTIQQRRWLKRRWTAGGRAWVLLQCRREWMLFTGMTANRLLGHLTKDALSRVATRHWTTGLNKEELLHCLRQTDS